MQQAIIAHCEQLADRFAVLDPQPGLDLFGADVDRGAARAGSTPRAATRRSTTHGCASGRPDRGTPVLVPPSGHVCGVIARSDLTRGVHKAPANEIVNGALGVERTMSDVDQGQLNLQGINVIRVFRWAARPIVWGARTTADATRTGSTSTSGACSSSSRSRSQEGHQVGGVRAEQPVALAEASKRTITEFLTRVWRDGALFGETARGCVLRAHRRGAESVLGAGAGPAAHRDRRPPDLSRRSSSSSASASGRADPRSARAERVEEERPWRTGVTHRPVSSTSTSSSRSTASRAPPSSEVQRLRFDDRRHRASRGW